VYVLVTEPAFKFIDPERSADQSEMPLLRAIRTSARLEEKVRCLDGARPQPMDVGLCF
jgi:hypothetical protein